MIHLNENQMINRFINVFTEKAAELYDLRLAIKKLKIANPEVTEYYQEYKDGNSSCNIEVDFTLSGWQSYSDDGLKSLLNSIIEEDDIFAPIVDLEIFEIPSKGRLNIKLIFSFVFVRVDVMGNQISEAQQNGVEGGATNNNQGLNNGEIIREIELRLSEIYTLLTKLKG